MKQLSLLVTIWSQLCWGWGEVGHHLIARSAVEILKNHRELVPLIEIKSETAQSFLSVFRAKQYQQGHLANIPDTYWRNLDHGFEEDGNLLGSPSHYFDAESFLTPLKAKDFSSVSLPLSYAETKRKLPNLSGFFREGSLPWRAQQFTGLYQKALSKMVSQSCNSDKKGEELTREVLTYAGLMAHFTGDVSMPYHASIDHDAIAIGQKGIHGYFENDLVSELELSGLYAKVVARAEALLKSPVPLDETPSLEILRKTSKETYPSQLPNQEASALMMVVLADSFSLTEKLRQLDYTYAIASLDEALKLPQCQNLPVVLELKNQYDKLEKPEQKTVFGKVKVLSQPSDFHDRKAASACRRSPSTRVNVDGEISKEGKTVAEWHEPFIVNRLALSAVLTTEIWAQEWIRAKTPKLCSTYLYAHKPSFISPTDPRCGGYALKESPKDFMKKNGKSSLPWRGSSKPQTSCVSF